MLQINFCFTNRPEFTELLHYFWFNYFGWHQSNIGFISGNSRRIYIIIRNDINIIGYKIKIINIIFVWRYLFSGAVRRRILGFLNRVSLFQNWVRKDQRKSNARLETFGFIRSPSITILFFHSRLRDLKIDTCSVNCSISHAVV